MREDCVLSNDKVHMSFLFKLADVKFAKRLAAYSNAVDLTPSQSQIIGYLHERAQNAGEVNPSTLEKHFHMSRPTMTGLLKRLESKGFIEFKPSSKDHRYKQVVLTDKAEEHHQYIHKCIAETEALMVRGMSDQEVKFVRDMVIRMIRNISESD